MTCVCIMEKEEKSTIYLECWGCGLATSSIAGYDYVFITGIIICITVFVFYLWFNVAAKLKW